MFGETFTYGTKEWYEQKGYIVYPASDFLETEIIPEYVEYIDTKYIIVQKEIKNL